MEFSPLFYKIILGSLWAFFVTVFAIPSILRVAYKKRLFDQPNQRTVHSGLTPRMGGVAIFAGAISAFAVFGHLGGGDGLQQVLAGTIILFFIGLKDDVEPVSAFKKFFVQVLAAGIVMFIGNLRVDSFYGFLGIEILPDGVSYAFTFLVIIGVTNAFNLIDGLDGLAGTIGIIVASTFGVYFYMFDSQYSILAFCLVGALLGFLRYNFHKAIIFMGDTGSLICGFIISILAIKFLTYSSYKELSPGISIGILIIPILDTLRVFIIRILSGKSPFSPDKNHIHHKVMGLGFSQIGAVLILASVNIFVIFISIYFSGMGINKIIFLIIIIALLIGLVLEIMSPKNKKEVESN